MKKISFLFLFFSCLSLFAFEKDDLLDNETEALMQARDFSQALNLYMPLLDTSLPLWQEARVRYNLGTIWLNQQQLSQALAVFESLKSQALSLPIFAHSLSLNQAIAYFKSNETLSQSTSFVALDQRQLFIIQSLHALEKAQKIECQLEHLDHVAHCQLTIQLSQWMTIVENALLTVQQLRQEQFINQAPIQSLAYLLLTGLNGLDPQFLIKNRANQTVFLLNQFSSLLPFWFAMQKQTPLSEQKETISLAIHSFLESVKQLKNNQLSDAKTFLQKSLEALKILSFPSDDYLNPFLLNIEILLLQAHYVPQDILSLKNQLALFPNTLDAIVIKNTQNFIEQALHFSNNKQTPTVIFFILAALDSIEQLKPLSNENTPLSLLENAIKKTHQSLRLTYLSHLIESQEFLWAEQRNLIEQIQKQALTVSDLFLPLVMKKQTEEFSTQCQQKPWDEVIPLFAQGQSQAQSAIETINQLPFNKQLFIFQQQQALKYWMQALERLKNPPTDSSSTSSQTSTDSINETFRLIQEMQAEDEPNSPDQNKEWKEW